MRPRALGIYREIWPHYQSVMAYPTYNGVLRIGPDINGFSDGTGSPPNQPWIHGAGTCIAYTYGGGQVGTHFMMHSGYRWYFMATAGTISDWNFIDPSFMVMDANNVKSTETLTGNRLLPGQRRHPQDDFPVRDVRRRPDDAGAGIFRRHALGLFEFRRGRVRPGSLYPGPLHLRSQLAWELKSVAANTDFIHKNAAGVLGNSAVFA